MAEDLSEVIRQNAQSPESASVDGVRVRQHSLRDQIEADRYLASRNAMKNRVPGIWLFKIVQPGTV